MKSARVAALALCASALPGQDRDWLTLVTRTDSPATLLRRSLPAGEPMRLSLSDAIVLAIKNNLDLEVARCEVQIAKTDMRRARGGGGIRPVDYHVTEMPTGVGEPSAPLLNSVGIGSASAYALSNEPAPSDVLTSRRTNTWLEGMSSTSGPSVPNFDLLLRVGLRGFGDMEHRVVFLPVSHSTLGLPI